MKDLSFRICGISKVWQNVNGHSISGKLYSVQFYYTDPRVQYKNPLVYLGEKHDVYTIFNNSAIEEKVAATIRFVKERPCREDRQEEQ